MKRRSFLGLLVALGATLTIPVEAKPDYGSTLDLDMLPGYRMLGHGLVLMWGEGKTGVPVIFPLILLQDPLHVVVQSSDGYAMVCEKGCSGFDTFGKNKLPHEFNWMAIGLVERYKD